MKRLWLIGVLCGVMGGACAEANFSARFDAYAPQEVLSSKGPIAGCGRNNSPRSLTDYWRRLLCNGHPSGNLLDYRMVDFAWGVERSPVKPRFAFQKE